MLEKVIENVNTLNKQMFNKKHEIVLVIIMSGKLGYFIWLKFKSKRSLNYE